MIGDISRCKDDDIISVELTTDWVDEDGILPIKDEIEMTITDLSTHDWGFSAEEINRYKRYLLSIGINPLVFKIVSFALLKNNICNIISGIWRINIPDVFLF